MFLEQLTLRQFRNYQDTTIAFAPEGGYITGPNGSGKTNLLEAIYYLANQASFRTSHRDELWGWGASQCMIGALVNERQTQRQSELAMHLSQGGRRLFLNGKETRETGKFVAHFTAVAFHPGTLNVIKGGPASRRHLVDRGILSLQPPFGTVYQSFQRLLKQRNALLRSPTDASTMAVWTERFIANAVRIMQARWYHVALLNQTLCELTQRLGTDIGPLTLDYRPAAMAQCSPQERAELLAVPTASEQWQARLHSEAKRLQRAEEAMGQTLFGPQRDDIVICYRERESRGYASQGQQRLAAFLLVAALAIAIHQHRGHRPVVLLDDVVSELDTHNRAVIFDFLEAHAFQVFITDIEPRWLPYRQQRFTHLRVHQIHGYAELQKQTLPTAVLPSPQA